MGRDLLYKPQVPMIPTDEEGDDKKAKGKANQADKLGVKGPKGRDLGGVGDAAPAQKGGEAKDAPAQAKKGGPAFKAAYFNKDSSGVGTINQRSSTMGALRGEKSATDLRTIVLPKSPRGLESPDPDDLRVAGEQMGLDGSIDLGMENMLQRQGAWLKDKKRTVDDILRRMKELEKMVALRKAALARMRKGGRGQRPEVAPVEMALENEERPLDEVEDVVGEGTKLIEDTSDRAEGMHYRIAKMLGIKRKKPE